MIFKRRRNKWIKDVITNEAGVASDKLNQSVAGEIVYRESAMQLVDDAEFAEDVNVGVTNNAPYHNTSDYTMIGSQSEDSTIDTQSS